MSQDGESIRQIVRENYGRIAETNSSCCGSVSTALPVQGGCCTRPKQNMSADELAEKLGYSAQELAAIPESNLGLSCGNPAAIAGLKSGQVVLDLGSGAGFDVFLAGPKVGDKGRVIGVDMTPQMLSKARANIASYRKQSGLDNVEFRLGEIEHLPVADGSVDVVISNCVINLSPDKSQVWREIARVLRPGGIAAISDIALKKELPQAVREMVDAMVGCVAGAVLIDDYRAAIEAAGLTEVTITQKPGYVAALQSNADPLFAQIAAQLPQDTQPGDYITSVDVSAKRRRNCCCGG
ncbi:MAG: arsenite methyltransferase [Phycisphaeraceae bacterium]|nr:arsenite methyltransferase [Phycisphaeraceae bacterium]